MNKRLTSLLLCFVMVFAMLATAVPAFAAGTVKFTMTADKTEASPGDTITYTVTMGPVSRFDSLKYKLSIPDGLTFVAGSGKLTENLKETLDCVDTAWTESTKVFYITLCNEGIGYTSSAPTELMKFQCKVNDDAAIGSLKIEFIIEPNNCYDSDYDNIAFSTETASVSIVPAPKPATSITLNKSATTIYTGDTETLTAAVEPADTTDTIEWFSDNTGVATVDNAGKVTAVAPGTATITVKAGALSASCSVTVENAPCTHINRTPIPAKASTCKDKGWDEYEKCNDCGVILTADGLIPYRPLASHITTAVAAKPANCNESGNKAYYVCSVCNEWFNDAAGTAKITDHDSVVISALGHDWSAATCTSPKTCKRDGCGATEGTALGHSYQTTWSNNTENHWHACSRCGDKTDIAAHTPDRTEATETDAIKCTECGYIITPALGHTHNMIKVDARAATCTENGNIEYYRCDGCGKLFADADGNAELSADETTVKALGHDYHWVIDKEATATESGLKHEECADCGDKKAPVEIDAKTEPAVPGDTENPPEDPSDDPSDNKPDDPSDNKPEAPSDNNPGASNPPTGSNGDIAIELAILLISCGAMTGTVVYNRKRKSAK